jgi:hypothetical protein
MAQHDDEMRASAHLLPLHGVADGPRPVMVGQWLWEDGVLTTVGLSYGDQPGDGPYVHVRTTVADPATVCTALRIRARPRPRDRERFLALRQHVAAEPNTVVVIVVDGRPESFDRWSGDGCWYAATRLGEYGLVVEARDVEPDQIDLVTVGDIEPYIAGRRAHLRALRHDT